MRRTHTPMPYLIEGSFTPRQVIAFVAVFALASLLFPIGVRAATGQNVNILDPVYSASKVRVHSNGALRAVLTDPVQGAYGKIDGSSARVGPPTVANPLQVYYTLTGTNTVGVLESGIFGPGQTAGIGSLTVGNNGTTDVNLRIVIAYGQASSCTGSLSGFFTIMVIPSPAGQTIHLSYPVPVQHSRPTNWCFRGNLDSAPAGTSVVVAGVGYKL